jgi:MFS family permease
MFWSNIETKDTILTMSRTCIAIGMTQADSTIASTAVLTITNDLGGFETSSWIFMAYLLTYSGMWKHSRRLILMELMHTS